MGVSAHPYKKKDKNQINTNKIMEQNMTTIPFDLELAKKINNGEYNGTIVTSGRNFRVEFVYYKEEGMYPILGVVHTDHGIISDWFSFNGCGSKNYRLELMVPEYTTFKDGDVLSNEGGDCIFILNTHGEYLTSLYASLDIDGNLDMEDGLCAWGNHIEKYKFATESERQKLVDALKASKEPKAKEYLKRFFGIEEKPKYEFKPFDKVLVRGDENGKWRDGTSRLDALNTQPFGFSVYAKPFLKRVIEYGNGETKVEYGRLNTEKGTYAHWLNCVTSISYNRHKQVMEVECNECTSKLFVDMIKSICKISEQVKSFINPEQIKAIAESNEPILLLSNN